MTNDVLRVFIGYDASEPAAFHVLSHSIHKYASKPVCITPIKRSQLGELYTRKNDVTHSTEFSLTRFLTPHLAGYRGWVLFMDCDMLVRADIAELFGYADQSYSVMCVKHDYTPKGERKMRGAVQTSYEKKNWSSLMLMHAPKCHALTPEYVNKASGLELHQFKWLYTEHQIGSLPHEWNWLVGEYDHNRDAKIVHYTLGGPWWDEYFCCDYADEWRDNLREALHEEEVLDAAQGLLQAAH